MRRLALVLTVVACGPKPAPSSGGGGGGGGKDPPAPGKAAPVTCDEVGVILRGTIEDTKAGPSKEQVIAKSCAGDKWADAVLQCVGSQARAGNCIEGLTDEQKAAYGKQMSAWADQHPNESMSFEESGWEPPPPPHEWTCSEGVGDAAVYAPPIAATGEDLELAVGVRKPVIKAACETGWSQDVLSCLQNTPAETCRAKLDAGKAKALTDKLAEADAFVAKVQAAKKKPAATFDCKKVVATYYADGAWKGKLADAKPKDRTKAIADSRAAMTKACTDEKWSANERACLVIGGADTCFAIAGHGGRWGFPALMVEAKTGIPECDIVIAHLEVLARCDKAPQAVRDAYHKAGEQMVQSWKAIPADQKAMVASACKQSDEAIVSSAAQLGCAI